MVTQTLTQRMGIKPILCICVCVIIPSIQNLTQTQTLRVNRLLMYNNRQRNISLLSHVHSHNAKKLWWTVLTWIRGSVLWFAQVYKRGGVTSFSSSFANRSRRISRFRCWVVRLTWSRNSWHISDVSTGQLGVQLFCYPILQGRKVILEMT